MKDDRKTKIQLISELEELRHRITELEGAGPERVQVEEALQESEERYRKISALSSDFASSFWIEPDGTKKVEWATEAFIRITGYLPEEIAASGGIGSIAHPEDKEILEQRQSDLLNEKPVTSEFRIISKKGNVIWLRDYARSDWGAPEGRVVRIYGATKDITLQKEAQEAIAKSESLYHDLVETSQDLIWRCDAEGRFTFLNQAWERTHGYTLGEMLGRSFTDFLPPDVVEQDLAEFTRHLTGGAVKGYETVHLSKSGEVINLVFNAKTLYDPSGNVIGTQGTAYDITDRKKARKKILQQQEELNTILDSVPAMIFYKDKEDRFIRVNKALAQAFNMSVEEIIGKTAAELSPVKDYWEDDKRVMETGIPLRNIIEPMETPEGTKWAQTDKIPYKDPDGNIVGIIGFAFDITARKRAEAELKQNAERLKTLREIDQAILAAQSPTEIAQSAILQLRDLVKAYRISILLFEPDESINVLSVAPADEETSITSGTLFHSDQFTIADPLWQGKVYRVDNFEALSDPSPVDLKILEEGVKSYVNIPLMVQEELIGTLNLGADRIDAFTEDQIDIAREVADSIAIALQQARLFEQVRVGRNRLQLLSRQLVNAQEAERRYIAQELHDEIGQLLTGLKLTIQMSKNLQNEEGKKELEEAEGLLDELLRQVRDLSLDLRPSMLDDLGLLPALLWQIDRFQGQTGIHVDFEHSGFTDERFIPELETTAYRIVQEALTNVARHANAEEVKVIAAVAHNILTLLVSDEGTGFDISQSTDLQTSLGLIGMRERAIMLGGSFEIESEVGKGTKVMAELPLEGTLERRRAERKS